MPLCHVKLLGSGARGKQAIRCNGTRWPIASTRATEWLKQEKCPLVPHVKAGNKPRHAPVIITLLHNYPYHLAPTWSVWERLRICVFSRCLTATCPEPSTTSMPRDILSLTVTMASGQTWTQPGNLSFHMELNGHWNGEGKLSVFVVMLMGHRGEGIVGRRRGLKHWCFF
jgi:hypothetical protein